MAYESEESARGRQKTATETREGDVENSDLSVRFEMQRNAVGERPTPHDSLVTYWKPEGRRKKHGRAEEDEEEDEDDGDDDDDGEDEADGDDEDHLTRITETR
eukprot:s1306_g4.t1